MSYASDHLAWQQRVNKEVTKAEKFERKFLPLKYDENSPLKGLADKLCAPYRFSDPNGIAKYDLKQMMQTMDCTQKDKYKRLESYRKSLAKGAKEDTVNSFQSTYNTMNSPNNTKLSKSMRKITNSLKRRELDELMASVSSGDVMNTYKYPKAKPFFHQAYIAKSKVDTLSQASSKLGRNRSLGHLMKAH